MLKQVPVSQENSNLDPQGPVATGNLDLQVRVFGGIPMGKPTGNPQGPAPMLSPKYGYHFYLLLNSPVYNTITKATHECSYGSIIINGNEFRLTTLHNSNSGK